MNTYKETAEKPMDYKKAMYCLKKVGEYLGISKETAKDAPDTIMLALFVLIDAVMAKEKENAESVDN